MASQYGIYDGGLSGVGGDALGIMPGEHDVMDQVMGRSTTSQESMPTLEDLMSANSDKLATDPYGALMGLRKGRLEGGYAPTASGVKYIFTGGSPYKRTIFDSAAEMALVIGAMRTRAAEQKRKTEIEQAKKAQQQAVMGGEG